MLTERRRADWPAAMLAAGAVTLFLIAPLFIRTLGPVENACTGFSLIAESPLTCLVPLLGITAILTVLLLPPLAGIIVSIIHALSYGLLLAIGPSLMASSAAWLVGGGVCTVSATPILALCILVAAGAPVFELVIHRSPSPTMADPGSFFDSLPGSGPF